MPINAMDNNNLEKNKKAPSAPEGGKKEEIKPEAPSGQEGKPDEGSGKEPENKPVDYAAELEKSKTKLEQAGFNIEKEKEKNKDLKKDLEKKDEEMDDKINTAVDKRFDERRVEDKSDDIAKAIEASSDNEDERKLIKHHYNNSIKKSGFSAEQIKTDIETAKFLANRKTVVKENTELKETIKAKNSMSNSGQGTEVKQQPNMDVKLSPGDQASLDRTNARRVKRGEEPLTAEQALNNN